MPGSEFVGIVRTVIEWAALGIEILGAAVIVAGVLRVAITRGTIRFLYQLDKPGAYESYKNQMGRSLLVGLEFLVAGDVVRTVALDPTLTNVGVLGLLVLICTFLEWTTGLSEREPKRYPRGGPGMNIASSAMKMPPTDRFGYLAGDPAS